MFELELSSFEIFEEPIIGFFEKWEGLIQKFWRQRWSYVCEFSQRIKVKQVKSMKDVKKSNKQKEFWIRIKVKLLNSRKQK